MIIDITAYKYNYPTGKFNERIKSIQFGNGFEQRSRDGFNTRLHSWDITFPAVSEFMGTVNGDLVALYEALLSPDPVYWISPYDILIGKSEGLLFEDATLFELDENQKDAVKRTYVVENEVSSTMLNDKLTSLSCRLKRYFSS